MKLRFGVTGVHFQECKIRIDQSRIPQTSAEKPSADNYGQVLVEGMKEAREARYLGVVSVSRGTTEITDKIPAATQEELKTKTVAALEKSIRALKPEEGFPVGGIEVAVFDPHENGLGHETVVDEVMAGVTLAITLISQALGTEQKTIIEGLNTAVFELLGRMGITATKKETRE